jgi:hypothetical protein
VVEKTRRALTFSLMAAAQARIAWSCFGMSARGKRELDP